MQHPNWAPSASLEVIRQRAKILSQIRDFFAQRDVLEVETPSMSHATVTDVHLHPFQTSFIGPSFAQGQTIYLMTSPEFHMKRLLAAGSGSIYQMGRVYRNEESGRHHNPEFTMLEWYRIGVDHHQLMDEMDALLQGTLQCGVAERWTYQHVFQTHVGLCPLTCTLSALQHTACTFGFEEIAATETERDTLLQLLFSMVVEPKIGARVPAFVYDFPASQAALARISPSDSRVAERFEVYFQGIELANGFHELDDAEEQLARFHDDNHKRRMMGLPEQPIDHHFIAALQAGLPDCSGVALGVDRLVQLALQCARIQDVICFDFERA